MGEFIGDIYDFLFKDLYGESLSDYLWGWECNTGAFTGNRLFDSYAIVLLISALALVGLYYYVWKPVRRQRIDWALLLIVCGVLNLGYAYYSLSSDYENGLIGSCMLQDSEGNQVITSHDIWGFGLANGILAIMAFFIFSMLLKWGSNTVRNYPF